MYVVARWLGRAAMLRWGKYFLVPPDKFARAEIFMRRYEAGGIFFARLLPVIRHLISIPAGIIRMGFVKFSILTLVGAGVWCTVLAWLGGRVGAKLTPSSIAGCRRDHQSDEIGVVPDHRGDRAGLRPLLRGDEADRSEGGSRQPDRSGVSRDASSVRKLNTSVTRFRGLSRPNPRARRRDSPGRN